MIGVGNHNNKVNTTDVVAANPNPNPSHTPEPIPNLNLTQYAL